MDTSPAGRDSRETAVRSALLSREILHPQHDPKCALGPTRPYFFEDVKLATLFLTLMHLMKISLFVGAEPESILQGIKVEVIDHDIV